MTSYFHHHIILQISDKMAPFYDVIYTHVINGGVVPHFLRWPVRATNVNYFFAKIFISGNKSHI